MSIESKLVDYLDTHNYQTAIQYCQREKINISALETDQMISLAKAYYATEKYEDAIRIIEKYKGNKLSIRHLYEINILLYKAKYLIGVKVQGALNDLENNLSKFSQYNQHLNILKELKKMVERDATESRMKSSFRDSLGNQHRNFMDIYEKQQKNEKLEEGMPMFLVSARWFYLWELYTTHRDKSVPPSHPGPITQFQILDHPFNFLHDPLPQKYYTNYFLFKTDKYKVLSKGCWEFLMDKYRGIQIKRWNIIANIRTQEVITQINLKEIMIARQNYHQILLVQISKKQSWKGLINKLKSIWKQSGTICELKYNEKLPLNQNQILEEVDSLGRKYFYSFDNYKPKDNKLISSNQYKCSNCKRTQNLKYCQCRLVKYCNLDCLKEDRDKHRKKCQMQLEYNKEKSAVLQNFNLVERNYGGRKGLVGLRNLGNTCYMNSGLQCLSNTKQLTEYFMSNKFMEDINKNNPLGSKGHLACAYAELIRQMWTEKDDVVSPFNLKKKIGKFAAQFSGFGQQDSQQFISYLIDGLQQDLNLVKNKQTFQTRDQVLPDEVASRQSQINYEKRIKSYVRDLMVGQFKSTVICIKCKKVSICFDPFMLVSLPIPTPPEIGIFYVPFNVKEGVLKIPLVLKNNLSFDDLKKGLMDVVGKYRVNLQIKVIHNKQYKIIKEVKDKDPINYNTLYNTYKQDYIFCYEFPQELNRNEIIRLDYYQRDNPNLISFPRYIYLKKNTNRQQKVRLIGESISRYFSQYEIPRMIQGQLAIQGGGSIQKFIKVKLRKDPNLLKYTQHRGGRLFESDDRKRLTLNDCLTAYSQNQILENQNEWYCNKCKQFKRAEKKMEIYKANKILVLSFKRFNRFRKNKTFVQFPVSGFDLGPFLLSNEQNKKIVYDLYGVVNHYGSLGGGHYTAFCQNFLNQRWYQFNDSRLSQISIRDIVTQDAYVLFYRRRN